MQRQRLSALLALCLGLFLGACSTTSQTPSVAGQPAPSALASPTTAPHSNPPHQPPPPLHLRQARGWQGWMWAAWMKPLLPHNWPNWNSN
ncbi:MAG: hypothetical protein HC876_03775 [Chloroflexaceae bacterium]|nr:hypothetical protein [Chloroflexaceae bacterium]